MKIFVDTNVLVSAFTARGLCADLLEVILADHRFMTGEIILEELERVLADKLYVPDDKVSAVLQFLRKYHVEPIPDEPSEINIRDEDDRWVLQSALEVEAEILVTGDKDLLDIAEKTNKIKIIAPRGFWESLKK